MSKEYATRYDELEKYVETDAAKCAFRTLLTTGRYYVYPNETKRSVKFRDRSSSRIPYSFIVTKRWLKFYVRTPAFESWQPFERTLVQRFGERFDRTQYRSNEGKPEWRVDLACVEDVEFLYRTCPDVPYPLVLAADASHDGPPPTVRGPRLGQSNRDPVFRNPTRSSSVGNTSSSARGDLQAITSYWCQQHCIRGKWLHPDDEHVLLREPHSFDLDYPAGQYVGDILRAPVVILGANGRYSSRTPSEFRSQDDIEAFLSRQKVPSSSDWASSLPLYYYETNYGQLLADGRVALLNACAYRSLKISEESDNRRVVRGLPSARFARSWLIEGLIPLAERGERLIVVKRGGLWKLNDLRGTAGVVFDPAPANPSITDSRHPGGPMALTAVRNFLVSTPTRSFASVKGQR